MNFNKERVLKAIACCPLLQPPGDEEVKKFAEDWLEADKHILELTGLIEECTDLIQTCISDSSVWCDEGTGLGDRIDKVINTWNKKNKEQENV